MCVVVRLREDRRTPLHSWRSQMCEKSIRIFAVFARILVKPLRFLPKSWLQNATVFAKCHAKKLKEKPPKLVPKP